MSKISDAQTLLSVGDYRNAITKLLALVVEPNPQAEYLMADAHRNLAEAGDDASEYLRWLLRSEQSGSAKAAFELGMLSDPDFEYANERINNIRPISATNAKAYYDKALQRFRAAADMGDGEAMYYLNLFYRCGFGIAPDLAQADTWQRKALAAGFDGDPKVAVDTRQT